MTDPVLPIEIAVEASSLAERARMVAALERLTHHHPNIRVRADSETGQSILCGQDEAQLQALVLGLRDEVAVVAGAPQAAYRESLAKPVELVYTHKKQSGGSGQFGEVTVALEPGQRGTGIIFTDEIKGGNIPREYIQSVEKGMRETAATGSLIGFPIIDFSIRLLDGKYHDMDSSALAFEITGRGAMREGARKSGITLLEPIMKVEVVTDAAHLAAVRASLDRRGARVLQTVDAAAARILIATARLAAMFGFDAELGALSGGKARLVMEFDRYAPVDPDPDPDVPSAAALRA